MERLNKKKYPLVGYKTFTIQFGYKMVSFDVKSLFTNVSLGKTIDITLERIYDRK